MYDQQPVEIRIQPHNLEAEQALLGALLLNNDMLDSVANIVAGPDFYDPVHGFIFDTVETRVSKGDLASPVTLKSVMAEHEGLAELGGTDYLTRLVGAAVSVIAAPDYAKIIRDLSRRRRAIEALHVASDRIAAHDGEIVDVTADLHEALDDAVPDQGAGCTLADALNAAASRMNDSFNGVRLPGIDLGIPELTDRIGNAQPGDMILLAGRPSMGKSAVSIEIARRCALEGKAIVYWCGEMAPEDNAERMMTAAAKAAGVGVPYNLARQGKMQEHQFKALLEAARDMQDFPFEFVESSIKDMGRLKMEIRRRVRRFQKQGKEVLLVFDYLQMAEDGSARSKYEEVSRISRTTKDLGLSLRCPSLVLAQLSRDVERREDKRPMLSDLRDSGQIEQDANTVIFCYRDEYYLERAMPTEDDERFPEAYAMLARTKGVMELIVAKQRSGPLGTARIGFDGATNSIYSLADEPSGYGDQSTEEMPI